MPNQGDRLREEEESRKGGRKTLPFFQTGRKEGRRKGICHPLTLQIVLGPEIMLVHGLVKFVPAVAYHCCLNLPATCPQRRTGITYFWALFLESRE